MYLHKFWNDNLRIDLQASHESNKLAFQQFKRTFSILNGLEFKQLTLEFSQKATPKPSSILIEHLNALSTEIDSVDPNDLQ